MGSTGERGCGQRQNALAGAAAGLRNVLWANGQSCGRDGADPDRLVERRPELFHAAHGQSECRRRSAVSLRAAATGSGERGRAGSCRVCAQLPQPGDSPGCGGSGRDAARPRRGDRQRGGEPGAPVAHFDRHQSRSADANTNHHLQRVRPDSGGSQQRRVRQHRPGSHQSRADHGSLLRFMAYGNTELRGDPIRTTSRLPRS